ncbi:MAG: DUF4440 domain-containing protein [Gammaproteobacteria bacterium]
MATKKKDISADITAANQQLTKLLAAGDTKGAAACYTQDAILMAPNAKACKGQRAIAKFWAGALAAGIKGATLKTTSVEQHGSTAIEIGVATLKGERGKVLDKAKYLVVWKREGRAWKLHYDIFNSNNPA